MKEKIRIAFFSDLHLKDDKIQSQTDIGAPSEIIPKRAQRILNNIKPDYVFNLGDSTSFSKREEWENYKKWVDRIKAPVFSVFGNHDRNYCIQCKDTPGEEYFTFLGNISDTKVLKIGNFIFLLVSEEHNPAGSPDLFNSTIPEKRFRFIEKILKKYSEKNNVFVLSHTPISGTTAFSTRWMCNNPEVWWRVSNKYLHLYEKNKVVAHLTGHTHIDYRNNAKAVKENGKKTKRRGKFFDGRQDPDLPDVYYLNMPCVDIAHGWISGRVPLLMGFDDSYKNWSSFFRRLTLNIEDKGPRIYDFLSRSKLARLLGKSAIYYFDIYNDKEKIKVITRCLEENKNVEEYPLILNKKSKIKNKKIQFLDSDLSLRTHKNITIEKEDWFRIGKKEEATVELSQRFRKRVKITGLKIRGKNIGKYSVLWKGKKKIWDKKWKKTPSSLGKVNAVWLKIKFEKQKKDVFINDINIKNK